MRRTFLALAAFSILMSVLIGLKTASAARILGWSAETGFAPDGEALAAGDGSADPGPGGDPGPARASGAPTLPPGASPGPSASHSPGATTPPAPGVSTSATTPPPAATSKTFTGVAVAIKTATSPNAPRSGCGSCHTYSISVTITVSGSRITRATAVYSPQPSGESLQDANKANASLSASILSRQVWNLGPVSGATYSANAWELSAKDAMSKAGLPV